ncbi:Na+/H+ antiporter subunit E [Thalassotalea sp. 1_MG-2023]|uniref:Na+/H+ antiporter subunit E n=1 Tax=Thalassotalea sp. 1_MG-2023 TaxID=3062680 RepID=UPI0026E36BB9|nr:Na+/H+ antiporter subunit E [Thalassotalea sp. 1_MG-2023]MDO6428313.1 Na+/H+ antiporter subunit E [Thalassotalea sp. 1_MG-2023]
MHLLKWAILLFGFWLLLSGYYQPLLLTFGLISVAIVVVVIKRMDNVDQQEKSVSTGYRVLRYFLWLISEIIRSSLQVTKLIWGPSKSVSPSLSKINVSKVPHNSRVLYVNSITLTPGTLSVDLEGDELTVHALQKKSIERLKKGDMENKLKIIWGENE